MALQLDRHGLWNLLGPSLFALGILATAWVRVGRALEGVCPSRTWVQGPGYLAPDLMWARSLSSSLVLTVPTPVLADTLRSQAGLSRSLGSGQLWLGFEGITFLTPLLCLLQTVRSVRRRHCYPPTWRRWLFYLCPGSLIAGSAILLYAFVETRDNYFYIHSIWHMLIAGSVGFLLPPRAKTDHRVPSGARARGCGYQLCINEQEELGLVGSGGATVSSICAS